MAMSKCMRMREHKMKGKNKGVKTENMLCRCLEIQHLGAGREFTRCAVRGIKYGIFICRKKEEKKIRVLLYFWTGASVLLFFSPH